MSKGVNELIAEEVLLRQARDGHTAAFVEFSTRWWPVIGRVAWSMLGNTAQATAITEEVIGIALRSPEPPEMPVGFSMYRLTIWLAIIRRRSSRQPVEAETPVLRALGRLYCMDRAAFLLRDVEQLSIEDAAAILETSPEEILDRVHRARIRLAFFPRDAVEPPAFDLDLPQRRLA